MSFLTVELFGIFSTIPTWLVTLCQHINSNLDDSYNYKSVECTTYCEVIFKSVKTLSSCSKLVLDIRSLRLSRSGPKYNSTTYYGVHLVPMITLLHIASTQHRVLSHYACTLMFNYLTNAGFWRSTMLSIRQSQTNDLKFHVCDSAFQLIEHKVITHLVCLLKCCLPNNTLHRIAYLTVELI